VINEVRENVFDVDVAQANKGMFHNKARSGGERGFSLEGTKQVSK
jgi:hypothetical protein